MTRLERLIADTDGMPAEQRARWIMHSLRTSGWADPSEICEPHALEFCTTYAPFFSAISRQR